MIKLYPYSLTTALSVGSLLAVLCSITPLFPAQADPQQTPPPVEIFLDFNKDGVVSYEEFCQGLTAQTIKEDDQDKDQLLSEDEIREKNASTSDSQSPVITFSAADTNHDKKLTAPELEQAARRSPQVRTLFDGLDANHDGFLSREELRISPTTRIPLINLLRIEF